MKQAVRSVLIVCAGRDSRAVTRTLARAAFVEIKDSADEDFPPVPDIAEETDRISSELASVDKALALLSAVEDGEKKKKLLDLRAMVCDKEDLRSVEPGSDEARELLADCEDITRSDDSRRDARTELARLANVRASLESWRSFDIAPGADLPAGVELVSGTLPGKADPDDVKQKLFAIDPSVEEYELFVVSSSAAQSCVAAVCTVGARDSLIDALREIGFAAFELPDSVTPAQRLDSIDSRCRELSERIARADEIIASYKTEENDLMRLRDSLGLRLAVLDGMSRSGADGSVTVVRGYCSAPDADRLKQKLESSYAAAVEISEPGPDEDVPVVLRNNAFARPLETITGMYSLPGKGDIDPTGVMAFFYYFFFGMMLSDAGYGLVISLGCAFLLLRYKCRESMKNTLKMYLFCGLSTVFWGAMYGSWFGDLINVVRFDILGLPKVDLAIWIDPINDLMRLMVYCFIFGLVHLFTGVVMKGVTDVKNGRKLDAVLDTVPTFLMVGGLAPIFFGLFTKVPDFLKTLQPYLLYPGVALVVLTAGRDSPKIGGKLVGGLYGLYDLAGGYLGDVLSYARLLALGLATGVIAQVINMLCTLPQNTAVRVVMLVIVGTIGHIANLGINIIGAYVHTNRLQYVEFFGKFYEGGGRALSPLRVDTKYFSVKEEN